MSIVSGWCAVTVVSVCVYFILLVVSEYLASMSLAYVHSDLLSNFTVCRFS